MVPFLDGEQALQFVLPQAQSADDVFHHHHSSVDDQAEIDGAQTHQVAGYLRLHHAGQREEKRKRNRERNDQRRPPIAEQKQQHSHDEKRAFEEIRPHRRDGLVDQHGAVIDGGDLHAFRQFRFDLLQLLRDPLGHDAAVFPGKHERGTEHGFLAVKGG